MSEKEMKYSRPHPVVDLQYQGESVEIDEVMAPLIKAIWDAGIETMMCCQEAWPGLAWIEFTSVDEALKFLNIAVVYDDTKDSLFARASMHSLSSGNCPDWEYQLNVMDALELEPPRKKGSEAYFWASVGIYFPHEDMEVILQRFLDFNEAKQCEANLDESSLGV